MKNMGRSERRFRLKLALFFSAQLFLAPGCLGPFLAGATLYLTLTAVIRFCPLWLALRIDSREINSFDVVPFRGDHPEMATEREKKHP